MRCTVLLLLIAPHRWRMICTRYGTLKQLPHAHDPDGSTRCAVVRIEHVGVYRTLLFCGHYHTWFGSSTTAAGDDHGAREIAPIIAAAKVWMYRS